MLAILEYNQHMRKAVWDGKSQFETIRNTDLFDCMIAEFLLTDGRLVHSEEKVLSKYKVSNLQELAEKQNEKLRKLPKLEKMFYETEMPLVSVLSKMEKNGIFLDSKELETVGVELEQAISKLSQEIKDQVGFDININSSVQIGNYLAEKENVPLKKTKTGRYATNETELSLHKEQFPILEKILQYRELSKLLSTYVQSLLSKTDEKGRIHTTYHQAVVNTGRLASTNPNMQNIPVTSEFGLKIKSCFQATSGKTLISFDYSQQELRILAHLADEKKLIEAFTKNQDVHKTTASQLFSVSYDDVTKQQRMVAKTVNFGIIYGMGSFGMSTNLNIPVEEAQSFIDTFYVTYPSIRSFYDGYIKNGQINGYVETLLGRRRYVFEFPGQKHIDNSMRRVLMNYPIQGSAADLMRLAMVQIQKEVLDQDPSISLLLQIHDDLVFEVDDSEKTIREFSEKIKNIMCNVYPLSVPVEVDVKVGQKWGELKEA